MSAVRITVHGRVQGVFYRDSTCQRADQLGVTGWVRNCSDGTVEGHFEGPDAAVEALIAWCRQGPARARVDYIETTAAAPEGATRFEITR